LYYFLKDNNVGECSVQRRLISQNFILNENTYDSIHAAVLTGSPNNGKAGTFTTQHTCCDWTTV